MDSPQTQHEFPPLDDRLVDPEGPFEMLDGKLIYRYEVDADTEAELEVAIPAAVRQERARVLLLVLASHGIELVAAERARIVAEPELDRLERWLQRALAGATLAEVLAG